MRRPVAVVVLLLLLLLLCVTVETAPSAGSDDDTILSLSFDSMPVWSSEFFGPWGSSADISIMQSGGSDGGSFLQGTHSAQGSSAHVIQVTVPSQSSLRITVWMKAPAFSSNNWWQETSFRLGAFDAENYDGNEELWTHVKKFSRDDGFSNGNGDQWVQYSLVFQTGSSNTVSVGFKVGSLGGLSPVVGWDSFVIQKVCAGAFDMPLDQSPAWTSVEDAPWGSSGSWQTVSNSHLEAQLGEEGSSARVLTLAISPDTDYTLSALFRSAGSTGGNEYWHEFSFKLGTFSAEDYDQADETWVHVKKFSNRGGFEDGNNNEWTRYTARVQSGGFSFISLGFKTGALGGGAPVASWKDVVFTCAVPPDCSSLGDCHGHGQCVEDNLCQCEEGFSGMDCSLQLALLKPTLQCVSKASEESDAWTAHFGFTNENSETITVPVGADNQVIPTPDNRGQPTQFPPGGSGQFPGSVLSVDFNEHDTVAWKLGTTVVTATSSSPNCPALEAVVPIFECVEMPTPAKDSYSAVFGYENKNHYMVVVPVGNDNAFTPNPINQGQPLKFNSGREVAFFKVNFVDTTTTLVWTVMGQSASATVTSQACVSPQESAPTMVSATLTDTVNSITVSWDKDTDMSLGDCDAFFTNANLGSTCVVTWISPSVLSLALGPDATILVNDLLVLSGNAIKVASGNSAFASGSTPLLGPSHPTVPVAVIMGPTTVSNCDQVVLDGTHSSGGAGRELSFHWELVSSSVSNPPPITSPTSASIVFSSLPTGSYVFQLAVTNWLGQVDSAVLTVEAKGDDLINVVLSTPSTISVTKRAHGSIQSQALVEPSKCHAGAKYTYRWVQTGGPKVHHAFISWKRCTLVVPMSSLKGNKTYTFRVTVSLKSNPAVTGTATLTVIVKPTPYIVTLSQVGLCPITNKLRLKARTNVCPLVVHQHFSWSCSLVGSSDPCVDKKGRVIQFKDRSTLILGAFALPAGEYVFSVVASNSRGQTATSSSVVKLVDKSGVPIVSIDPLPLPAVGWDEKLVLNGRALSTRVLGGLFSYTWVCMYCNIDLGDRRFTATGNSHKSLVVKPKVLVPRGRYDFLFSAMNLFGRGSATISVQVSDGPYGGTLSGGTVSSPSSLVMQPRESSIVALKSLFRIVCSGWSSPSSSRVGLEYRFSFSRNGGPLVELAPFSSRNWLTTPLPSGEVRLYAHVRAGNSASTTVSMDVHVAPLDPSEYGTLAEAFRGMIDDRFEEEDYESIAHMANVGMILIRSELGGSLLPPSAVSALQSLETDLSNGLMSATTAALSIAKDTSKTSIKRGLRSLWLSSTAILSQTSHVQKRTLGDESLLLGGGKGTVQAMEAIKRYSTMAFNRTGFALVQQLEQAVDQLDELGGLDGVDEVTTVDTSQGGDFPLLSSMTRMASELTDGDVEDLETASQPTYFDEEDMQLVVETMSNMLSSIVTQGSKSADGTTHPSSLIETFHHAATSVQAGQVCGTEPLVLRSEHVDVVLGSQSQSSLGGQSLFYADTLGVTITLPSGFLSLPSDSLDSSEDDQCLHSRLISWPSNSLPTNPHTGGVASSRVFSFSVHDAAGEELSVHTLANPIDVRISASAFPLTAPSLSWQQSGGMQCMFFDVQEQRWSTTGVSTVGVDFVNGAPTVHCQTRHLGIFAVGTPASASPSTQGDASNSLSLILGLTLGLGLTVVVAAVSVAAFIRFRVKRSQRADSSLTDPPEEMEARSVLMHGSMNSFYGAVEQ